MYLHDVVNKKSVDDTKPIPWLIQLFKNLRSLLALPGKISPYNYDCLHILLEQDIACSRGASIVGFCMGNDSKTNKLHLIIFKNFSRYLYPKKFRFSAREWCDFNAGLFYGKTRKIKDINKIDFTLLENRISISYIRKRLDICPNELNLIKSKFYKFHSQSEEKRAKKAKKFQWSSSFFGVLGGILVASKTVLTPFGFIFLATSSFQLLVASLLKKDKSLVIYAASIFCFVDVLGIYRWLISN